MMCEKKTIIVGFLRPILGVALCVYCTNAHAELLSLTHNAEKTIWSVFLDGGALNGSFSSFEFRAASKEGAEFSYAGFGPGLPLPPGMRRTYRNQTLDFDPNDPDNPGIGRGWLLTSSTRSPTEFGYSVGPVGEMISTAGEPDGRLFLANLYMPASPGGLFSARVILLDGATTIADETIAPFLFPSLGC